MVSGLGKQPTKQGADTWITVIAKVASGYKGSENVGRVGVALSRNSAGGVKLIVYKSSSNLLSTLLLTSSLTSSRPRGGAYNVILRESYMQFYDDEQHFWSLHFVVPKDEGEFTDAVEKLGLPIERVQRENKTQQATTNTTTDPGETLHEERPLLRLQQTAAAVSKEMDGTALAITEELGTPKSGAYDSGSESTQSADDILVLPSRLNSINKVKSMAVPVITSSSTLSLAITTQAKPQSTTASSHLEMYLDKQRTNGNAMEKKMDTILQTMARLAVPSTSNSTNISEASGGAGTNELAITINQEKQEDKMQMARGNHGILAAMSRLTNMSYNDNMYMNTSHTSQATDNEDELLELEQKLLNFKKENRSLMKSLKAKEQALCELRASTCALCEELLLQNNELMLQNQTLISAMSVKVQNNNTNTNNTNTTTNTTTSSPTPCSNCDDYRSKVAILERSIASLQSILHSYMKRDASGGMGVAVRDDTPSIASTATSPSY